MSQDRHVINQRLREFTIGICNADKAIIGTGVVVSDDGKIATCAHVVRNAIDGESHPRDCIGQTIRVYFPQARREEEKRREARVVGCLPDHDDDIVLLELTAGLSPVEPGKYAHLGSGDEADGDRFQSWGYRRLDKFQINYASGVIVGSTFAPEDENWLTEPLQLKSDDIDKGMSGAAVLDVENNVVVGLISQTWYPLASSKDRDTAFGVNARVLSLVPLSLTLYEAYPRQESTTPRLTDQQQQQVKAAPTPAAFDLSRAPDVLPEWVGRADLLASIAADYADSAVRVTGLIGFGGEGKTSLARKALDAILSGSNRPTAVFWWSFYEQRSSDEFFEAALTYLGGAALAKTVTSASARAGLLAGLLSTKSCVFVLDGFEVMQHDTGDDYGLIISEALRDFLDLFASPFHDSVCLITSRAPLVDLLAHTTYRQRDVTRLSEADGRDLLRRVGVTGSDAALDRVVRDWDGHALTLSLLGSYLAERFGGDVAHVGDLPAPQASDDHYERVARVLRRYDEHLSAAERAFLLIFSAFRLPVRESCLRQSVPHRHRRHRPQRAADRAGRCRFRRAGRGPDRAPPDSRWVTQDGAAAYSAHPLIRAHYAERLESGSSAAAHRQIADYYQADAKQSLPRFPTLDDLAPYIEIVHHLCHAGAYDEAWQVYRKRIYLGQRGVLVYALGAWETDLALMTEFFPGGDLSHDPAVSSPGNQRIILSAIGLCLMSLGRLRAAVPFIERVIQVNASADDWFNGSIDYLILTSLYIYLGELDRGVEVARVALELLARGAGVATRVAAALAKLTMHENPRYTSERDARTTLARALHLRGGLAEATAEFARAEALERKIDPNKQYLYGLRGIFHAEHQRRAGDAAYARRVSEANLTICERNGWKGDLSGSHRVLGDLDADAGDHDSARAHYDQALSLAHGIQQRDVLIEALLARGRWYARFMNDPASAFNDLNEVLGYALAGGFRIYEADIRVGLAWAHLRASDKDQARSEASRAKSDSAAMGYHWGQVDADEVLAALDQ